jgi:serine/threonine protein kinase
MSLDIWSFIFIVDVKGVVQLIEPEDSSNNSANQSVNKVKWLIMKRVPGCSLKEFIAKKDKNFAGVIEAIHLALNLVGIVKQVHNKSIFHQNLSPENIMIEWDSNHDSINHAQLTLLNFSQAVSALNSADLTVASSTQKWYQPLHATTTTLSSTVDASGVCAIIFWLLTKVDPRHNNNELPHQEACENLNQIIDRAVKSASM